MSLLYCIHNVQINQSITKQVFTQQQQFDGTDTPMGRFIKFSKVDESYAKDKIEALSKYGAELCDKDIQEKFESTQSCLSKNSK
jgi:hypothetical protein